MVYEAVEDFFLNKVDIGRIFDFMERSEYLLLYNVQKCTEVSGEDRAYTSELAKRMKLSVVETSRAIKAMEDKGYVTWQTDENKERTFVKLTGKAKEAMERQNEKMAKAYRKISSDISADDIRQAVTTLEKMREIIKEISLEQ